MTEQEHYCQEHDTRYFKRGNMKSYAHPIGQTGKWCNEGKKDVPEVNSPKVGELPEAADIFPEEKKPVSAGMTKEEWAARDIATRKSIERQKALDLAVQMVVEGKVPAAGTSFVGSVLTTATVFEQYLDKGLELPAADLMVITIGHIKDAIASAGKKTEK